MSLMPLKRLFSWTVLALALGACADDSSPADTGGDSDTSAVPDTAPEPDTTVDADLGDVEADGALDADTLDVEPDAADVGDDADLGPDTDTEVTPPPPPPVVFVRGRHDGPQDGLTWETAFVGLGAALEAGRDGTIYVSEDCCFFDEMANGSSLDLVGASTRLMGGRKGVDGPLTGTDPGVNGPVSRSIIGGNGTVYIYGDGHLEGLEFGPQAHLVALGQATVSDIRGSGLLSGGFCGGLTSFGPDSTGLGVHFEEIHLGHCDNYTLRPNGPEGAESVALRAYDTMNRPLGRKLAFLTCIDGECGPSRTEVGFVDGFVENPKLVGLIVDPDEAAWLTFMPKSDNLQFRHYVLEASDPMGPWTVVYRSVDPDLNDGISGAVHLPDPEKFYVLGWGHDGTQPNRRSDLGTPGQLIEGLGTTTGLIVAPAANYAVGTTITTDLVLLDRVPAMTIQVLYPPAE